MYYSSKALFSLILPAHVDKRGYELHFLCVYYYKIIITFLIWADQLQSEVSTRPPCFFTPIKTRTRVAATSAGFQVARLDTSAFLQTELHVHLRGCCGILYPTCLISKFVFLSTALFAQAE